MVSTDSTLYTLPGYQTSNEGRLAELNRRLTEFQQGTQGELRKVSDTAMRELREEIARSEGRILTDVSQLESRMSARLDDAFTQLSSSLDMYKHMRNLVQDTGVRSRQTEEVVRQRFSKMQERVNELTLHAAGNGGGNGGGGGGGGQAPPVAADFAPANTAAAGLSATTAPAPATAATAATAASSYLNTTGMTSTMRGGVHLSTPMAQAAAATAAAHATSSAHRERERQERQERLRKLYGELSSLG